MVQSVFILLVFDLPLLFFFFNDFIFHAHASSSPSNAIPAITQWLYVILGTRIVQLLVGCFVSWFVVKVQESCKTVKRNSIV